MITIIEGVDLLDEIIEFDLRPVHFQRTVSVSKQAASFLAKDSEDQRHKLKEIRKSEDKEQEDQRVRLSNAITSVALAPPFSYVEEVWRTDAVTKAVEEAPDNLKENIASHFSKYFHDDNLHRYCFSAALHFAVKTDPNAWTIFEAMFDTGPQGERTITDLYPVEVSSDEVRGFRFDETGKLQYLAFEFKRKVYKQDNRKVERELSDFYLYGAGFSIHYAEYHPDYVDIDPFDYEAAGYSREEIADRAFWTQVFENTTTEVPAIRWSAWWDDRYRLNEVGEVMYANALPKLEELLKDNSLLQLQKYIHIFAEKHEYVQRCKDVSEEGLDCISGYYGGVRDSEHKCRSCGGSGKMMVKSEQESKTLAWPDHSDDIFDLAKLTHYVERPLGIVEFYRKEVDAAIAVVMYATFNQQNVDQGEVVKPETATKTRLDYDKIYNKLSPFAELVSRAWEKAQRTAFQYYGAQDVVANMTYPHDFKMKSLAELTAEFKLAKEAGVSYSVLHSLESDMVMKQYRNTPMKAADILAFNAWKPWKDKTTEEIVIITQNRADDDTARILWENWDQIIDNIMIEQGDKHFSSMPPDEQKKKLYEETAKIMEEIQYKSMPDPFSIAPIPSGEEEEEEEEGEEIAANE